MLQISPRKVGSRNMLCGGLGISMDLRAVLRTRPRLIVRTQQALIRRSFRAQVRGLARFSLQKRIRRSLYSWLWWRLKCWRPQRGTWSQMRPSTLPFVRLSWRCPVPLVVVLTTNKFLKVSRRLCKRLEIATCFKSSPKAKEEWRPARLLRSQLL